MSRKGVVIVAAGRGQRMMTSLPKQFLQVAGKPILIHSIEKFISFDPEIEIVLVLNRDDLRQWERISHEFIKSIQVNIAYGGKERYDSVISGLSAIRNSRIVGIHDAVRPCAAVDMIERCYSAASARGSGIPVVPLKDSIRKVSGESSQVVNRSEFRIVQTPQVFDLERIKKAYMNPVADTVTDDATVYESVYKSVYLVDGDYRNIKVTTQEDLFLAEALLSNPSKE